MFIATAVVSVLLAAILVVSARGKLVRDPRQVETLTRVGVTDRALPLLAAAEIAGALGLVAGLFWWPLGAAAAVGVIAYFVGAVGSHLRIRDFNVVAPVVLLVAGGAALTLRVLTY
ncbi:DoxX family protein [Actinoplanes couchii]|uniref:Membrane protein n=1 Tax=Actinoplanes couchii TaxID=403638 RepID=A0ABQ3X6R3_9ACTN|nr:DoxX family protein [Actinoplanes couchii]MDR6322036.1 putative membrane protein YphA (DoxX/SURF4 family) [Actinoplanes couchii]GID54200.1 membrane protein [Actinoplanes couchii]